MDRDLAAARELATDLALAAGRLQTERRGSISAGSTKAHANDFVSDVDLASELLIVNGLTAEWPDDGILAEEGSSAAGTSRWRWVVDPLDGTRNYMTGAGPWSVSIALQEEGRTQVAVVHDPVAGETFSAVTDAGAWLGTLPLSLSAEHGLADSIVGLSFNPSPETKVRVGTMVAALLPRIGDLRRVPAALNLAYTAADRFAASVLVDVQPWDVAAGLLIAAEAGAVVAQAPGREVMTIAVCRPALRKELFELVAECA